MVARTFDQKIQNFDRAVTEVIAEKGAHGTWRTRLDATTEIIRTTEPSREEVKSWLIAVRQFDSPGERDTYLPEFIATVLDQPVSAITRGRLTDLLAVRDEAQWTVVVQGTLGEMNAREAFELLAYTGLLHRDAEKMARAEALGPLGFQFVRTAGVGYANTIQNIAVWTRVVLRNDLLVGDLFAPPLPGTPSFDEYLAMSDIQRKDLGRKQMRAARRATST